MAVKTIADAQRTLDVDDVSRLQRAQVRFPERLFDYVEADLARRDLGDSQAHAVHRDALPMPYIAPIAGEREAAKHRADSRADDANRFLDDAGEHDDDGTASG